MLDAILFDRTTSVTFAIQRQYDRFASALQPMPKSHYLSQFLALEDRGYVKKDQVYGQMAEQFGWPVGLADKLTTDYYTRYPDVCVGFPGLEEVLASLTALPLKLGLVTNGREIMQRSVIAELGIAHYFDAILISEVEGVRKPDVRIFQRALERLDVAAEYCLFVGDHPLVDVEGAQRAGMRAIWKRDEYWGDCPAADWIVDDLRELLPICYTAHMEANHVDESQTRSHD